MIRHVLFFTLRPGVCSDDIERVRLCFLALPKKIRGISMVEWGVNDSPENKNAEFTHCVMMTFIDEGGRQDYLYHVEHEALKALFVPVLERIIVVDYKVSP
ncbi:Dabb family protein [Serratia bockelmannii]|uniref:Dabb family protein n=1 Tax=Serratia bockelmannii TaxID=2703793 RepID=UPI00235E8943|nr:Dabb family protein [Serratia bockelmannii]